MPVGAPKFKGVGACRRQAANRSAAAALCMAASAIVTMHACAHSESRALQPPLAGLGGPMIIAHRGGALEAPENTLPAIRHGVASGADWQEIDVTLTRDERVVVIHDETLGRTTSGSGRVSQTSFAELRRLDAGTPRWPAATREALTRAGVSPPEFGEQYSGTQVPTLAEALAVDGAQLMIELKAYAEPELLARKVVAQVRDVAAGHRVMLASFQPEVLWAVYNHDPELALLGLAEQMPQLDAMLRLPVAVVGVSKDIVPDALKRVPRGVAIWAWTAYGTEEAFQLMQQGVHGVITDAPEAVVRAFREPPDPVLEPSRTLSKP